ncbi:MAG: class II aldolase/adducin family protein [Pseudomonadales bacterium]|nr:class II aldolase/adducin family protein [Pseudomonadales bacterium]
MATSISSHNTFKPDAISEAEWQTRVDLAAAYRLVAHYGWDDIIFTHLSARVPGNDHHFLINPFGMLFGEITASSLVKVDEEANIIGNSEYGVNPAGFTIHSAVHIARPEVGAVMHLHTRAGLAISAQKSGLLPLTQTAMFVTPRVTYHDFEGVALNHEERERIVADLGEKDLMILRNHGTLAAGNTIQETFIMLYFLEKACEAQVAAQTGGELNFPSDEAIATTAEQTKGIHMSGHKAWPALLRMLDRQDDSYRQ